ncbi:MAG TPA: SNF2-related protein [Acidimicrobiales bacterium]|nr:SNF2-related protein [Acidimicrobiales bacterium]
MQHATGVADPPQGPPPHPDLVSAAEAAAAGEASATQLALLEADRPGWVRTLEDLLEHTEDALDRVRTLPRPERDQVVADFEAERDRLLGALDALTDGRWSQENPLVDDEPTPAPARRETPPRKEPDRPPLEAPGEARLQVSWAVDRVVAWAAGPGADPLDQEGIVSRLEGAGAPASGWTHHQPVPLPTGGHAPALTIDVGHALGWLVAAGAGEVDHAEGAAGASVTWLGRVAVWAVRLVARGAMVPQLRAVRTPRNQRGGSSGPQHAVRWVPALVDAGHLDALVRTMPGAVGAVRRDDARAITLDALEAFVHAIASDAAGRLERPAPPPAPRSSSDVAEAVVTRLDGSSFPAPARAASDVASRLERWAKPVAEPQSVRLVVQLDPPDDGNAWFLSVLGPNPDGNLVPVEVALVDGASKRRLAQELARLERLLPALQRPGGLRRGQVYLSGDEAWELMSRTGPALESAGFDVRVPALSRRKPTPSLRLTTESSDTVVGAHQLADVRWSALFDDVELTAAEIAELAAEARPMVRSRGKWVELDRADLAEAAAALAERASKTRLTGAEVLRWGIGLEGAPLAGGVDVVGRGWATDLIAASREISTEVDTRPPGFEGELRSYQAEALAWLGFLDTMQLGGCLALDMGLGKTPTVLAHLARTRGDGPSLVVAPPAVVGNWAAEAARFTPDLRVVVHHGAARATAEQLEAEVAAADLVITTYGTAVRDVDALAERPWRHLVLDEAQAIKNPASETAQQLREIPAAVRVALTGTPVENGLGDLWAILDWANPGLIGPRSSFVAALSTPGTGPRRSVEQGLRALNGILVFRRTKSDPAVAGELPDRIDELDRCTMTAEQIGLYQAVLDRLVIARSDDDGSPPQQGAILAAITALKQICNHPAAYQDDGRPLPGRSGKLARLEEIVESVFASGERVLVFTHFAEWGKRLAAHLTEHTGVPTACYHGGLSRTERDRIVHEFQNGEGPGALVLSLKAGGTGLNLTAASHVVLFDRWWNPAVEDQARDRAWRIGQTRTVISHRLVCPGTVDERVEEVVAGKRHIADLVLPASSSLADLNPEQLRTALGLRPDQLLTDDDVGDPAASSPTQEVSS